MLNQNIALVVGLMTTLISIAFTSSALANSATNSVSSSSSFPNETNYSSFRMTSIPIVNSAVNVKTWCAGQGANQQKQLFGISNVAYYRTKATKKGEYALIGCVTNNSGKIVRRPRGSYVFAYPDKKRPTGGHVNITSGPIYFKQTFLKSIDDEGINFESVPFQPNEVSVFEVTEQEYGAQSVDIAFYTDDYDDYVEQP